MPSRSPPSWSVMTRSPRQAKLTRSSSASPTRTRPKLSHPTSWAAVSRSLMPNGRSSQHPRPGHPQSTAAMSTRSARIATKWALLPLAHGSALFTHPRRDPGACGGTDSASAKNLSTTTAHSTARGAIPMRFPCCMTISFSPLLGLNGPHMGSPGRREEVPAKQAGVAAILPNAADVGRVP